MKAGMRDLQLDLEARLGHAVGAQNLEPKRTKNLEDKRNNQSVFGIGLCFPT